jgi:transposase
MKAELKAAVQATGSRLMGIHGIGPAGTARILADAGDVARFPDRSHFASWTGTAPIDASSGQHLRHRLSRAGSAISAILTFSLLSLNVCTHRLGDGLISTACRVLVDDRGALAVVPIRAIRSRRPAPLAAAKAFPVWRRL